MRDRFGRAGEGGVLHRMQWGWAGLLPENTVLGGDVNVL